MDSNIAWHRTLMLEAVARQLEKNNFRAYITPDAAAATAKVLELVGRDAVVGFGGSQTVKQLGIVEQLAARGQRLLSQQPGMSAEAVAELRRRMLTADVYIASPNAVMRDGTLLIVDKIGNRAAGMLFGPKTVIAIAGRNKIVADENAGWERVDQYAAPVNAKRLAAKTPCTATGRCADCASGDRICNIAVTLMKRPAYTDYHVILVNEELGY
jgi:L-lactate utilization protein LutB